MNRDTHLIFEGYKRNKKIERITSQDGYGRKVCFRLGDYVEVVQCEEDPSIEGMKGKILEFKQGDNIYNSHLMTIKVSGIPGISFASDLILLNQLNQINIGDRDKASNILDI